MLLNTPSPLPFPQQKNPLALNATNSEVRSPGLAIDGALQSAWVRAWALRQVRSLCLRFLVCKRGIPSAHLIAGCEDRITRWSVLTTVPGREVLSKC